MHGVSTATPSDRFSLHLTRFILKLSRISNYPARQQTIIWYFFLVLCRLKANQAIPHTGMVIVDVGMLSGFRLSPGAAASTDLIRSVEILPDKVSLYLDSVSVSSWARSMYIVVVFCQTRTPTISLVVCLTNPYHISLGFFFFFYLFASLMSGFSPYLLPPKTL